jgi:hypothetical protein
MKAIHATLGVLLEVCTVTTFVFLYRYPSDVQADQAANGVITSYNALADILVSIENFLHSLKMYTVKYHSTPSVDEVVVNLMMELISTLALVTGSLAKRRSCGSLLVTGSTLPHSSRHSQMCEELFWC